MSYSCSDFTDDILEALQITVPEKDYESPSAQADLALAEIERLQRNDTRKILLIDALRGLVADVQAAYGSQGQEDDEIEESLREDWPDLVETYKRARMALTEFPA